MEAVVISAGTFEGGSGTKSEVLKPLDIVTTAGATADIAGALNTAGDVFSTTMKIKAKGDKNEALEEATALSNESLDGLRDDAKALAQGADPRKVAVLRERNGS